VLVVVKLSNGEPITFETTIGSLQDLARAIRDSVEQGGYYEIFIEGKGSIYINPEHVVSLREAQPKGGKAQFV
jgi:hypothetical protein